MEWGSAAAWAAALGTTASVAFAVRVAAQQASHLRRDHAVDVNAWITRARDGDQVRVDVVVCNSSGRPAYDIVVGIFDPPGHCVEAIEVGMLEPRKRWTAVRRYSAGAEDASWHSDIRFTDAAGHAWHRDLFGRLKEKPRDVPILDA